MKQELPISVILLALGAWCCVQLPSNPNTQTTGAAKVASEVGAVAINRGAVNQSSPRPNFRDERVVPASWQNPVLDSTVAQPESQDLPSSTAHPPENVPQTKSEPSKSGQSSAAGMRVFPPAEFLRIAAANDLKATAAIVQAATGIQQLPAFATRTKISSQLLGVSMTATGKYFQSNGGEKSRMEIQYVSPVAKTVLQMSDGRFVYFLKSDQQQQKLEFIDLFRLSNDRGKAQGGLLPTSWVMGGGIGKAISHYTDSFDFQKVSSSQQAPLAQGVTTYRGIWKPAVLLHLIHAGTPAGDRPQKVVWDDVPRQLPHAIELTFTGADEQTAVPAQISFFKFSTDQDLSTAKEMVRIEFSPFEFKNELPDELFTLESTDFEATDVTGAYQSKIRKLSQGMDKVANQGQSPYGLR